MVDTEAPTIFMCLPFACRLFLHGAACHTLDKEAGYTCGKDDHRYNHEYSICPQLPP